MPSLPRLLQRLRRTTTASHLHWLTADLAIAGDPGEAGLAAVQTAGVRSLLDLRAETPERAALAAALGLRYLRLPVVEGEAPSQDELRLATDWVVERLQAEGPVLLYCREGRGRSALVGCATLVRLGLPLIEAYRVVQRAQPALALNQAQTEALQRFAADRDGAAEMGGA